MQSEKNKPNLYACDDYTHVNRTLKKHLEIKLNIIHNFLTKFQPITSLYAFFTHNGVYELNAENIHYAKLYSIKILKLHSYYIKGIYFSIIFPDNQIKKASNRYFFSRTLINKKLYI